MKFYDFHKYHVNVDLKQMKFCRISLKKKIYGWKNNNTGFSVLKIVLNYENMIFMNNHG